jgi:nitrite reductase/ring-hydroxylating ferredoxin subunit
MVPAEMKWELSESPPASRRPESAVNYEGLKSAGDAGALPREEMENLIARLIRELSNVNKDARWAAAFALAELGDPAVEPLIQELANQNSVVRLRAAWALGQIRDPRPVDQLINTLRDGDWSVRMYAAEALGRIGSRTAVDALVRALRDENVDVRRHVISALSRIADPSSADRLGQTLNDPDWRVRLGAALALGSIGDPNSLHYLENALCDQNEYVRMVAESATKKATGRSCSWQKFRIGLAGEIAENTMKGILVQGKEILVANVGGTLFAIGNVCTHKGCMLTKGALEGDIVRCSCHGSAFSVRTGSVVQGPAKMAEPRYDVLSAGNDIWITLPI